VPHLPPLPAAVPAAVPHAMPPPPPPATLRVAYQGSPGAYSEAASVEYFVSAGAAPSPHVSYWPCPTFAALLGALASGGCDRAVLPIENSLAGTIHANLDLLLAHPHLAIVGEHDFRVRHCLLALPGTALADVKVVRSHYMALAQCTAYLERCCLVSEVAGDTAGSAERIRKERIAGAAAIASRRAAELYGLDVLAEGIEDDADNYTRFLVLARGAVDDLAAGVGAVGAAAAAAAAATALPAPAVHKTSIVFTLNNEPGALLRALSVFNVVDIDLTKIESRHIHTVLDSVAGVDRGLARRWGYVFYVDFARGYGEECVQNALRSLRQITPFFRCLGSYARCVHSVAADAVPGMSAAMNGCGSGNGSGHGSGNGSGHGSGHGHGNGNAVKTDA
jgi:arogenate/prephenate dehydratase